MLRAICGAGFHNFISLVMDKILDLYIDYLQVTFRSATATGLSSLVDGAVSHDQITRFLSKPSKGSKELWLSVKSLVRQHESEDACLIFDDSIIEKPHTDESDLICWHYDHSKKCSVKGINLLTAFYHSQDSGQEFPLRIPVAFQCAHKSVRYSDLVSRKLRRKSVVSKNELMRMMFSQCLQNQLKFRYVLADSWFSAAENMRLIHNKEKYFIFEIKSNRMAALTDEQRNKGRWQRIDELQIAVHTPVQVWLKDLNIKLLLVKQIFTNKDGSTGTRYLVSNDLNLSYQRFETLFQKRWSVEEYHKSIKQNAAAGNSPTRTLRTQTNHLFAAILAYVKMETYKFASDLNHFAIKSKLYMAAIKAAFQELNQFKDQIAAEQSA